MRRVLFRSGDDYIAFGALRHVGGVLGIAGDKDGFELGGVLGLKGLEAGVAAGGIPGDGHLVDLGLSLGVLRLDFDLKGLGLFGVGQGEHLGLYPAFLQYSNFGILIKIRV